MPSTHLLHLLIALVLTSAPSRAQSLYDVVASLSDRERVVNQRSQVEVYQRNQNNDPDFVIPEDNPIDWHEVGINPTQASVDELGIGDRIALLNQAVQVFERLKYEFLNCGNAEFTTGASIETLFNYGESDFDPLPRAAPENYHALLMALAQRVGSLRTMRWVAGFKEIRETRSIIVQEHLARDENDDYYVVTPENLPANFEWKPATLGPDNIPLLTTKDDIYSMHQAHTGVSVIGTYYEKTEQDLILRTATRAMFLTYYESVQLITTAPGAEGTQIDGVASILRRSKWHELSLTGAHVHFDTSHAGHVVVGSGTTQNIPLIPSAPALGFNGAWKTTHEEGVYKTEQFITDGFQYLEAQYLGDDDAYGAYENNWKVGSTYTAVFVPAFSRGIDVPAMRTKLETAAAFLASASADGKFLLNPRPGLLFGIEVGPGLKGMGNGYVSCGSPRGPRSGSKEINRFDSTYSIQFAGNAADYHVIYDNERSTRPQSLPGLGWFRQEFYEYDYWTLSDAWDSPRLKQIVGRDLVADVIYDGKHYGGYTVKIYRRPTDGPALVPGQTLSTDELILVRTWAFSHAGGEEAHPTDAEELDVAGTAGENYEIKAIHLQTDDTWYHWQWGWWPSTAFDLPYGEQGTPPWREVHEIWGWTLKAMQGTVEKYRKAIELTYPEGVMAFNTQEYLDGQLLSTLTSTTLEPFSDRPPSDWEITADGKTISGTAVLGNPYERDHGYGKWATSMTIDYDEIQPDAAYIWDAKGMLSLHTQGPWGVTGTSAENLATFTHTFNEATISTQWIEFLDGGNKVKTYTAPDGTTESKAASGVAWTEIEYGTATNGLPGLPHELTRKDGSEAKWTWAPGAGHAGSLTYKSGFFSGDDLTNGQQQVTTWNERGYTTESEAKIVIGSAATVANAKVPAESVTTWGAPKEWKDLLTKLSSHIAHDGNLNRPASITSPFGLTTDFSNYDVFGRAGQVGANGVTAVNTFTGLGVSTTYSGTDVVPGSQSSSTANAAGTTFNNTLTWGGVAQSSDTVRGASATTVTGAHGLYGSSETIVNNADGSLSSAEANTLPFGGLDGADLEITSGLFVSREEIADAPGTFEETHTDAWGRIHKIDTPSKDGSGTATTDIAYSSPSSEIRRTITTEPTGRVLITESDSYSASGTITRSGIDVNGNESLGASDRYTESITSVESGKIVTTLSLTEDSGLREIMKTTWTPSTGVTITKINGNEETITTTPNYTAKTVTTSSTKGWNRTTSLNNLGLATANNLSGTGIPATNLSPEWRADGSLKKVTLTIGGENHEAEFNANSTLSSLTAPGRGNILGEHSISNGVETLTIDGETVERSLDGTEIDISGGDTMGRNEKLTTNGNTYNLKTKPAIGGETDTAFNAALAPTGKSYAAGPGEAYSYSNELLASASLARGGSLQFGYSNDSAKDLTSASWPAMASVPFTSIPAIVQGYSYNRSGQVKTVSDPSGTRGYNFYNGRVSNTVYTAGFLKGYEVVPSRDQFGRQTGTSLKRDGATIHSTAQALNGASDQITNLGSGSITATPQRDGANRIIGYIWSDGTNTVTQTWQRGVGGRIEAAGSNVSGVPSFDYLLDPNDPGESFDARGRRLKCQTAGGAWTYTYGIGGQLSSATHPTLGTFNYSFDGIGRRTDKGTANTTDILNRTTAWTHSQNKTLTINAHPNARVWFNGVEIQNFTGQHQAILGAPGTSGQWVPWETLAILEGAGEGAGSPAPNPLASPDAKAEKSGAVWVPPAAETFVFDAAGNRESSAQWDYGWNAKNQLAGARTKTHTTAPQAYDVTFTYDSEGRRVKKHVIEYQNGSPVSEKIITFVWDGWDLLYERHQLPSGLTLLERKYLWGPDIADGAAGGAGGLLLIRETKGSTTKEIIPLYDGTGHVVALTDINKNLLAEYAYGPFGEKITATGTYAQSNPWRYATKYLDEETGLYYFGHRYLDPVTGQWLSREPLGESESINLYSYAGNDPVNKMDVLGLFETQVGVDSLRMDLLLGQLLRDPNTLPTGPPEEAINILRTLPNSEKFGLSDPYSPADYQRAQTHVEGIGIPTMTSQTWEEAEFSRLPRMAPGQFVPPESMFALSIGGAPTQFNASINSDWLMPAGAGGAGLKVLFGGAKLKTVLPVLTAGAKVDATVIAAELRTGERLGNLAANNATVYRVQPRGGSDIVTGGAFRRAREGGANLVESNALRQRLLGEAFSSNPTVVRRALVNAQASGRKSPFISTTFNRQGALDAQAALRARGIDSEMITITGPRSAGLDFNSVFRSLGGRTKRFQDADLDEFGIPDLFIPSTGTSRSGFSIIGRQ